MTKIHIARNALVSWDDAIGGQEALRRCTPAAGEALDRLTGAVSSEPAWVALARTQCATTLELTPLPAPSDANSHARGTLPSSLLAAQQTTLRQFCEQFSVDVSTIDDDLRKSLTEVIGQELVHARGRFVAMTYVADFVPRVRAALDRLFPATVGDWQLVDSHRVDDALSIAYDFVRIVYNCHELDPVLSEMIRLRGARAHNCRLCKSVRSRLSVAAGATEGNFDSIDDYQNSDLPADRKAALALVDAIIWRPARISDVVMEDVRRNFRPEQAVEIVLDVMRNAWNKTTVTVGLDEPNVASGTQLYEFHDDGTVEYESTAIG